MEVGLYKRGKRVPSLFTIRKMEEVAKQSHGKSIIDILYIRGLL